MRKAAAKDQPVEIIVDSNEALPQHRGYRFPGAERVLQLDCADYSGWEIVDRLRIERKSLADFLNCCGGRRDEFEVGTLQKMVAYQHRYLLLEFSLPTLAAGCWAVPKVSATSAIGSVFGWSLKFGVIPIFAGDAAHGAAAVVRIVSLCTKHKRNEQTTDHAESNAAVNVSSVLDTATQPVSRRAR